MRRVESFDIFDTVLTRRVGDPRAAFLLLGMRLIDKEVIYCSAQAFAHQRTAAEVRCFRNAGGLDSPVNLESIYEELRPSIGIDPAMNGKLMAEELDLEGDLLVPMVDGIRRVAAARGRGHDVAFVSDMYMPSWFLRDQLDRHGLIQPNDQLIVSNEYSKSKATGALWPDVIRELGVEAKQIHHTGNDKKSDFINPKKAGLRATHVDEGNLNRFERQLETWSTKTDGMTSLLAGASRQARTQVHGNTDQERAIRDVAAGVVAPFLVGNVLWILQQANAEHIEKIYFVARDGQVLLDIARKLAPSVGYTGELHYLFGSRAAWVMPGLTEIDDAQVMAAVPTNGDTDIVTLRLITHRFGIEPERLEAQFASAELPSSMWDDHLTPEQLAKVRTVLSGDDSVMSTILGVAAEQRAMMLRYLDQEGVVTSDRIAIVDQGTGSTLFNALSSVLDTIGQRPPHAFYFGLRVNALDQGFGEPQTYVRNEQRGIGFLKTPGLLTLVEMACTADHGSVVGYHEQDERVVPTLTADRNTAVLDWGFEIVRATVNAVVDELCTSPAPIPRHVDLRPATIDVFDTFWTSPTRTEAAAWSAYPFEDGWGTDSVSLPLAHRQGLTAVVASQPHRHWWNGGAEALSDPVSRTLLRSRAQALMFARRVRSKLT